MKILIIYRHFWPDSAPYGAMLRSIGKHLSGEGHEVAVWSEHPGYKSGDLALTTPAAEVIDGMRVSRMGRLPGMRFSKWLRLADKALFPLRAFFKAIRHRLAGERYDLVMAVTTPVILSGMFGRLDAKILGADFLYHCQDIYPELGAHMGFWRSGGLLYRLLGALDARTRRKADYLVTLSQDMLDTVTELARPEGHVELINGFLPENFADADRRPAPPPPREYRSDRMQLIFAGNLGVFQGLEGIVDAMRLIEQELPGLELLFLGEGKALPGLRERAKNLGNVLFKGHLPQAEAQDVIARADMGIVSLEPNIYRVAYPCKTFSYLGLGLPVLAIVEPRSELAHMVAQNGLGVVSQGREIDQIADALRAACRFHADDPEPQRRIVEYFDGNLSREHILSRWSDMLDRSARAAPEMA